MACGLLDKCKFFKEILSTKPVTAASFQQRYCLDKFANCARYLVAEKLGTQSVPDDLFPNQNYRIAEILENA